MKEFEDTHWWSHIAVNEERYTWHVEVNQHGSKMVPIYGDFYSLYEEDIYVILQNYKMDDGRFDHHLHIWVGAGACEQDVRHAERYAASLDLWLRRRTLLHWERQDQECEQFHSYFSPVLQYLPGKYHNDYMENIQHLRERPESTGDIEKSLFSVYIHKHMRKVKQVKCDMSSLNKRDPLVLITEADVMYVLGRGSWSPDVLTLVGHTIAYRMRFKNFTLRLVPVVMLDKTAEIEDWDEFYKALGWEHTDSFLPVPDGIEEKVESAPQDAPQLYEILRNRRGHIYYRNVPFPFERNALDSKSLYILTKGKDDVCLWIGKKNQDRNKAKLYGLAKLQEFISRQMAFSKWPPWQHMTIIPEGMEPQSFKEHFHNWIGRD